MTLRSFSGNLVGVCFLLQCSQKRHNFYESSYCPAYRPFLVCPPAFFFFFQVCVKSVYRDRWIYSPEMSRPNYSPVDPSTAHRVLTLFVSAAARDSSTTKMNGFRFISDRMIYNKERWAPLHCEIIHGIHMFSLWPKWSTEERSSKPYVRYPSIPRYVLYTYM